MKFQSFRTVSRVKRLTFIGAAVVGAMALAAPVQAQTSGPSRALNVYGGAAYGLQIRTGCDGAAVCESGGDTFKMFGGYRMTPNLATELTYYYLGKQRRTWGPGSKPGYITPSGITTVDARDDKVHAFGVGVNLETEVFSWMTNHLRVGLAMSRTSSTLELSNGAEKESSKNRYFPYAGVGASALITQSVRLVSGIDVLLNPDRTYYLVTAGIAGEF